MGPPKSDVVSDDIATTLPEGVSRDLSSNAQMLAAAPEGWFRETVAAVREGGRRWAIKDISKSILRQAQAVRLELERRLGELLAGTVQDGRPRKTVVSDDSSTTSRTRTRGPTSL